MIITLVQQDIVWKDPEANLKKLDRILSGIGRSDLVVLPEMFTTGFVTDPAGIAEKTSHPTTLLWMAEKAEKGGYAITGSVAMQEKDGSFRNRMYLARPDEKGYLYDKRHIFTPGAEGRHFTRGYRKVIPTLGGGERLLLQICYDLRFPAFSRNSYHGEIYDIAVYCANWPKERIGAWDILLKARAIENQCFVVGVNRVGKDETHSYPGHSMVISPSGEVLSEVEPDTEGVVSVEVDVDMCRKLRRTFPVLNDGDKFTIERKTFPF